MNDESRPEAAPENTAGGRVRKSKYPTTPNGSAGRVGFVPTDVLGCVRVDLARPADGQRFDFGEVGRRLYRATVGIPAGMTLQIVVSDATPTHDVKIPDGVRTQIVAPDAATLKRWLDVVSAVV